MNEWRYSLYQLTALHEQSLNTYCFQKVYSAYSYPSVRLVVGLMLLIKECTEKGSVTLSEGSKLHINSEEVEKVGQVLEVCAVLLNSARKDMTRNKQAASTLCSKIVPLIPRILQQYGSDSVCNEALSIIISEYYHVTVYVKLM